MIVVRVTENDGKAFRDVKFQYEDDALRFKAAAEEDGTYWGIDYSQHNPALDEISRRGYR